MIKAFYKAVLRRLFEISQHLGVDVLPRHFYSEIPDLRHLRVRDSWKMPYSMAAVAGSDTERQWQSLRQWLSPEIVAHLVQSNIHQAACDENGEAGFGRIESDILFAYVATQKPAEIFQIGCGVSTAVCLAAAKFAGYTPSITCVEPWPTEYLKKTAAKGSVRLIKKRAEEMDLTEVDSLGNSVLFFVDSSHTLGPAGEVSRIILEMVPRLKDGAHAHFHDILFPYDYDRHILKSALFFSHESPLLHAFLCGHQRCSILASLSMLHYSHFEKLKALLPHYEPASNHHGLAAGEGHFPSSIYLQFQPL